MKFLFFLFSFITISQSGSAQIISKNGTPFQLQLNTITTAVPFLRIPPDARSSSMGDAGIAISPDANSIYWNTSKWAFSKNETEFSASYSPWLKNLVDDMHHIYGSGYKKIGDRHAIGGAFRYFSIGNISFFDPQGNLIREFNPTEIELTVGYAYKLASKSAIGLNVKHVRSNLTGGISAGTIATKPGVSTAVDLSYSYMNDELNIAGKNTTFSFGTNISNLGNKMSYTVEHDRNFIPTNLGLGTALKVELNDHNSITSTIDFNKLLVPTPPTLNGSGQIISGKNNNVGVIPGIIQSFYDAPGNAVQNANGTVSVQKGSRLREELNEINIGGGVEYWYADLLALRAGYFHQHNSKGGRQYITLGVGARYSILGFDLSYLAALSSKNPLANTLRFSLIVALPGRA